MPATSRTQSRTQSLARGSFLQFLDYFCALFALVLINTSFYGTRTSEFGVLLAVTIAFVSAWILWRLRPGKVSAAVVGPLCIAVLEVANSPISVAALWLGLVALSLTFPRKVVYIYCALPVIVALWSHISAGSPASKILLEVAAMLVAVGAGLTLADSIKRAIEDNQKLRVALRDSRELALAQERERIAASLHDGLGHRLTIIGMSLDYSARILERDPGKAREELVRARAATSEALNTMRQTVRAMKPVSLNDEDLGVALRRFAASFDSTGLNVTVVGDMRSSLSEKHSNLVLHFVQEALTNVVRHTSADTVIISISETEASVSDNGGGNERPAGFGLTSLRDRAAALGADLVTEPHGGINAGFRLALVFPQEDRS